MRARSTSRRPQPRLARRWSCSTPGPTPSRAWSRLLWAHGCGPTSSSARASTSRLPSGRSRSKATQRPGRWTHGRCSSSASGCGTSTTSTAPGRSSPRPSARRSRRATSRRSRTSCSIASHSRRGRATGARRRSSPVGMNDAFEQLGTDPSGIGPWLVFVDAHAGRLEPVQAVAARGRPREPIVAAILDRCLGLAALAAGDHEAADRDLSAALAELDRVGFREPAIWRVDGDAIEAAVGVGDLARAEALAVPLRGARRALADPVEPRRLGPLPRPAAARPAASSRAPRPRSCRALAEHEHSPVPFERARTLLVQGQVLRRLKRKRRGAGCAGRGAGDLPTARRGGMGAAGRGRARPGRRPPGAGRAERDRAADRHPRGRSASTNQEIAAAGLRHPEGGGGEPRPRLPQARHPLARPARQGAGRAPGSARTLEP